MNEPREEWQAISTLLRTASDLLAKCEGHYGRSAEVVALEAAIEAFYETGEPKAHALTRSRLAEVERERDALRSELERQWWANHVEHCDGASTQRHRKGVRGCSWPPPAILDGVTAP